MDMISSMKGLAGGVLIGLSAVMLMALLGRIAGISGITRGALLESGPDRRWRLAFVLGLISGPLLLLRRQPHSSARTSATPRKDQQGVPLRHGIAASCMQQNEAQVIQFS